MKVDDIRQIREKLACLDRDVDDVTRIDRIAALEAAKAAICAAQAIDSADLDISVRAAHAAAGLPTDRQGQGTASQIALARRESPTMGQRHLALARLLTQELPHTLDRMKDGQLSEWRATIIGRGVSHLGREDRQTIDTELCSNPTTFEGWSDKRFETETRRRADRLDAEARIDRNKLAESQRRVTLRPAQDGMAYLTALLPLKQAAAVKAALMRGARDWACTPVQDAKLRTQAQVEADLLVERITGARDCDKVDFTVDLVMTDTALLHGGDDPAHIPGHSPMPAATARDYLTRSLNAGAKVWIRRLYAHPETGELVAMESRKRLFPKGLVTFLTLRDDRCRTPYCGAPIRHADHIVQRARGGATSGENGNGRCASCNYAKEAPGFTEKPGSGATHSLELHTPTGHTYTSTAPPVV